MELADCTYESISPGRVHGQDPFGCFDAKDPAEILLCPTISWKRCRAVVITALESAGTLC